MDYSSEDTPPSPAHRPRRRSTPTRGEQLSRMSTTDDDSYPTAGAAADADAVILAMDSSSSSATFPSAEATRQHQSRGTEATQSLHTVEVKPATDEKDEDTFEQERAYFQL